MNIYQGGQIFRSSQDNIFPNSWTSFSHLVVPLTAFDEVLPGSGNVITTSHPVGSLPFSFGFMSSNSANQLTTKVSGIDNLKITLWTVPEPSAATLCGSMGLVLCCSAPFLAHVIGRLCGRGWLSRDPS